MLRVLDALDKLLLVTGALLLAYLTLLSSSIGYALDPALATSTGLLLGVQLACLGALWIINKKGGVVAEK